MENTNDTHNVKRSFSLWVGEMREFLRGRFSLDEDKAQRDEVVAAISKGVVFRGVNLWVLIFATMIASLGLNVNSAAVIIGAMLISPIMGPIMGIGLSLGINDFELLKKALRNYALMFIVAIITSTVYFLVSPLSSNSSELLARTVLTVKGFDEHYKAVHGRDWIAMTAHFGCWEYCSYWGLYERSQMLVAVYHPLRSKVMERLYQRLRNYENSMTVAMKDSLRFYLRNRECGVDGKNLVMGLIADQNPPRRPDSHWFRFLNQDTIFFDGGEKLALRCKLPVYFVRMDRLRRGRYQMSFEPIYDGEEQVAEYEITERYVRKLEAMISEHPELWMWSHRRWKHKRTNAGR